MLTLIKIPTLADIPESEHTPTVFLLLNICHQQQEIIKAQQLQIETQQKQIDAQQQKINFLQEQVLLLKEQNQELRDEIARLKGHKPKPQIRPSTLEKNKQQNNTDGKRPGSAKRSKTEALVIHNTIDIKPTNIPEGSEFIDHANFTVQDILINPSNTVYRLEHWVTPEGKHIYGQLPSSLGDGHFGPTLVSFILYQYYHAHVTQPLILEELREFGIDISSGQVNRIITEKKDLFHKEKDTILSVGLAVSSYVNVDDTGARHKGKNGYCTHIGNQLFAWFETTESKSRINFLKLLRAGNTDYVLNEEAYNYMRQQKLPQMQLSLLELRKGQSFAVEQSWNKALKDLDITSARHIKIATEGALLGIVLEHGVNPDFTILSDDAGQFDVLSHALCWLHAERLINKLIGVSDEQREALEKIRTQIWDFYAELKKYKLEPTALKKIELDQLFDDIFTQKTCFATLNKALGRLHKNKKELLLVLDRPDIPLHNNESEQDIREYVKKRKISGSTRSDLGRRCRDTFASLKKTCRKLRISFWKYVNDRVSGSNTIPPISEIILQRSLEMHA